MVEDLWQRRTKAALRLKPSADNAERGQLGELWKTLTASVRCVPNERCS